VSERETWIFREGDTDERKGTVVVQDVDVDVDVGVCEVSTLPRPVVERTSAGQIVFG